MRRACGVGTGDLLSAFPTSTSWLCRDSLSRDRLLDMERRIRPARRVHLALVAIGIAFFGPPWTLAMIGVAAVGFWWMERSLPKRRHPEYTIAAAWCLAQIGIGVAIALTGAATSYAIAWLAIPIATLPARFSLQGVIAGVGFTLAVLLAATIAPDPAQAQDDYLYILCAAVVVLSIAIYGVPLMTSDAEHRSGSLIDPLTGLLNRAQLDYEARSSRLETAGAQLLDTGDEGISSVLGAFWDAWESLSLNPTGLAEKSLVAQSTKDLASTIRDAAASLTETAQGIETDAKSEVNSVNELLSNIATYNAEIMRSEVGGESANDMRDLRYQALTKLAESLPINYQEESDGTLTITLEDYSGDVTLLSHNQAGSLTYDDTNHRVTYSDYQGTAVPTPPDSDPPAENELSSGRLNGLLTVYKSIGTSHDLTYVLDNPDAADITYVDRLNAFASTLITQVNTAHGSSVFSGTDASDIEADATFTINSIDTDQALNIAELQDAKLPVLADSQFSGYLSDFQQRLGLDQQNALSLGSFQETLRLQLEEQQQSVSGVSIDEEMVDLLKFQQVYQAAAKVIEHTSEMLNAVINMV